MSDDRPDPARQLATGRTTALAALRTALSVHEDASATHERTAMLLAQMGETHHADRHRASADRARAWQQRASRLLSQVAAADGLLHLDELADTARRD